MDLVAFDFHPFEMEVHPSEREVLGSRTAEMAVAGYHHLNDYPIDLAYCCYCCYWYCY